MATFVHSFFLAMLICCTSTCR